MGCQKGRGLPGSDIVGFPLGPVEVLDLSFFSIQSYKSFNSK